MFFFKVSDSVSNLKGAQDKSPQLPVIHFSTQLSEFSLKPDWMERGCRSLMFALSVCCLRKAIFWGGHKPHKGLQMIVTDGEDCADLSSC